MAQSTTGKKPNILILWGDDIGYWNISHYSKGMMGYQTPNIDRVAKEGATFTDWSSHKAAPPVAPASSGLRSGAGIGSGLTKVGMPGATVGLPEGRPDHCRIAEAARLRRRSVRQEPSRRSRRIPAEARARLRPVLRQPVSLERRRRAGTPQLCLGESGLEAGWRPHGVLHCVADGKGRRADRGHGRPPPEKRMESVDGEITAAALA